MLVITLVVLAQYAQTYRFDYALDDTIFITNNEKVKSGLTNISQLFRNARSGELQDKTGYRPITLLTFAAESHYIGQSPGCSHIINIFLYTILCALLLMLLQGVFPKQKWLVFWVILLYASHPLHVEAVANVKGRDELLASIFGLLHVYLIHRYTKKGSVGFLVGGVVFILLSFLSKESGITFTAIAMTLVLYGGTVPIKQKMRLLVLGVGCALLLVGVRIYVHSDGFYQDSYQELSNEGVFHWDGFLGNPLFDADSWSEILPNSLNILRFSVQKFVQPLPLVHDYSFNHLPLVTWSDSEPYLGLIILVVSIISVVLLSNSKWKMLKIGLFWFYASLSVYLSIVQPATDIFAERFMFNPSLGLSLVLVSVLGNVFRTTRSIAPIGIFFMSTYFTFISYERTSAWQNTKSLLTTDISKLQDCVRANYNYALLLHQEYNEDVINQTCSAQDSILDHYRKALSLTDRMPNLYLASAKAQFAFGYYNEGKQTLLEAIEKYPKLVGPSVELGKAYMSESKFDSAVVHFTRALTIGPENDVVRSLLASALLAAGNEQEAIIQYQKLIFPIGRKPELVLHRNYIGACIVADSLNLAEAALDSVWNIFKGDSVLDNYRIMIATLRKAEVDEVNAPVYTEIQTDETDRVKILIDEAISIHKIYNRFSEHKKQIARQEILKRYHAAIELCDTLPKLYLVLGNAYMEFNERRKAYVVFREMNQKFPNEADSWGQLGHFMTAMNQKDSALYYYEGAVALGSTDEDVYLSKALLELADGEVNTAVFTLLAGEKYSSQPTYYLQFIEVCRELDRLTIEKEVLDRGIDKFPESSELRKLRGF